ncbi:enoyl-CoA hydratase/isomerase family protein [Sphingomonas sp. ST-64]|uniref:Enoyl-CoA hydratase/isomerase family protein n=1 Tax=Sphingomonas plantiphila TaxID=3163295 RepID=A0ABW8YNK8_9SPHN
MSEMLTIEVADHIATVTMRRAPVNALGLELRGELIAAFDRISESPDIRVAILCSDQRVFCGGADLKDRPDPDRYGDYAHHARFVRETGNAIKECFKPVIAAVDGAALGAGFGLAMACDITLASEKARFGMPEINVGLAGGAAMLSRLFPKGMTRRLMFTGAAISAEEACRFGAVDAVHPSAELMPAARALAAEIASKSPLGIRYAKISCNMVENMPAKDGYRMEQNFTQELSRTDDAKEARAAFLEKRAPVFKGY